MADAKPEAKADAKPEAKPDAKPTAVRAAGAPKRTKKVVESEGVAHITATFNNTLITITDLQGNAITWGSSGKAGFKGEKTPFPSFRYICVNRPESNVFEEPVSSISSRPSLL